MNSTDEALLAWALADSVAAFLKPADRTWLCVKIGAGEQDSAIRNLLVFYANADIELSGELAAAIQAWIQGYSGTDSEPILWRIYSRISVSDTNNTDAQQSDTDHRRASTRTTEKLSLAAPYGRVPGCRPMRNVGGGST
ncbi:hypothetical protein [Mycobacterium sp.]|uniref:hypothetical protein n=1 Tax=Mycobacterium sp. TaxID=1785 RepID=UPI003D0DBFF7